MDDLIADLHIHSKYSHDSLMSPERIVKRAKKVGLNCIAITDHGTIRGGVEGRKAGKKYGVKVIIGSEIKTDCGDIIGLALENEIHANRWGDVITEIKDQNGRVILPHPYRDHTCIEQIATQVDFIECRNARSTMMQNSFAEALAEWLSKPMVYGSDAHVISEIGAVKIRIDPISFQIREIKCFRYSTIAEIHRSQIICMVRQRKWGTLILQGMRYFGRKEWPFP
jgi:hypothetical protein